MYINSGYLHNSLLILRTRPHAPGGEEAAAPPSDPSALVGFPPTVKRKN